MDCFEDSHIRAICGSQDLLTLINLSMEGGDLHLNDPLLPVSCNVLINNQYEIIYCDSISYKLMAFNHCLMTIVYQALWWI